MEKRSLHPYAYTPRRGITAAPTLHLHPEEGNLVEIASFAGALGKGSVVT
jgi:hypothetical protein